MAKGKTKGRSGKNPTKTELQLRGQLNRLLGITKEIEVVKNVLEGEASTVLETLWNSHIDIQKRLSVIEAQLGIEIEEEPTNVEGENETASVESAGSDKVRDNVGKGEDSLYSDTEGNESEEVPGQE